jgi:transposase
MIVIGVDTHKRNHALAAVDGGTGRVRGSREIKANQDGHLVAVRWARSLDEDRVWAIEDCRHVSGRLEQALVAVGERVVRVPPKLMGASRRGERERGKSDEIDAVAIARAVVRDDVERFPVAYLDARAMEIRLLCDHREQLIRERTRLQNGCAGTCSSCAPSRRPSSGAAGSLTCASSSALTGGCGGSAALVPRSRAQLAQIRTLTRQADQLDQELLELIRAYRPALLAEQGCGTLTAAILIGHTAGAERFRSEACFARQSGSAPIRCCSGKRTQYRLDRGSDRQLNRASWRATGRLTPTRSALAASAAMRQSTADLGSLPSLLKSRHATGVLAGCRSAGG